MDHETHFSIPGNFAEHEPHVRHLVCRLSGMAQDYRNRMKKSGQQEEVIRAEKDIAWLGGYIASDSKKAAFSWLRWLNGLFIHYSTIAKEYTEPGPFDPFAQAMLASALALQGDLTGAEAAFDRAVALATNDPTMLMVLAWVLPLLLGRAEEAVRLGRRAMELDPASSAMYAAALAVALYVAGEYEQALEMLRLAPLDCWELKKYRVLALAQLGHVEEAREAAERFEIKWGNVEVYIHSFRVIAPAARAALRAGAAKAGLLPAAAK